MKLPGARAEQALEEARTGFRAIAAGTEGDGVIPQGCSLGKKIACAAGGLVAAVSVCGLGSLALTPPCILALDQLASLGCCDCLPGPLASACRSI